MVSSGSLPLLIRIPFEENFDIDTIDVRHFLDLSIKLINLAYGSREFLFSTVQSHDRIKKVDEGSFKNELQNRESGCV